MTKSVAVDAAQNFLEVVWNGDPPSDAVLIAALDRLLAVYHETPAVKFKYSESEPPRQEHQAVWDDVAKRFPDYGFYAMVDPLILDGSETLLVGDAIDDIADISKEMRDTVWYAENLGVDYAHWFFCELYPHWGHHARDLTGYLFARLTKL